MKTLKIATCVALAASLTSQTLLAETTQAELEERVTILEEMLAERQAADDNAPDGSVNLLTGYDKGFFIATPDDDFKLKLNGMTQLRYTFGSRDTTTTAKEEVSEFDLHRTRLGVSGNVYDPKLFFKVEGDFGRSGGTFKLTDAYVGYKVNDNVKVRVGQFKEQLQRETLLSIKKLSAVDKSLVNGGIFPASLGRVQGADVEYKLDEHRFVITLSEGYQSRNTGIGDENADAAIAGRYEFKPFGDWKKLADFTSSPGDPNGLLFGIAGHAEEGKAFFATTDLTIQLDTGTNIFISFDWQEIDDMEAHGLVIQLAQFIAEKVEPFLRYEYGGSDASTADLNLLTAGANYYIKGHDIKLTGDVGIAFDSIDGTFDKSSIGWQQDEAGQDGQIVARIQLQLAF
ncbi:porin [Mucisphaera sp.]|uniref:porin n=1 Tax=Mucisphaera sp. TaxID=2913024 RepID=UPI003D09E058